MRKQINIKNKYNLSSPVRESASYLSQTDVVDYHHCLVYEFSHACSFYCLDQSPESDFPNNIPSKHILSRGIHAFAELYVQLMSRQVTGREDLRRVEACDSTRTVDILTSTSQHERHSTQGDKKGGDRKS
jgi:hypothetical protein